MGDRGRTSPRPLAHLSPFASRPANRATHAPRVRSPRMMDAPADACPMATESVHIYGSDAGRGGDRRFPPSDGGSSRALRTATADRGRYRLRVSYTEYGCIV